MSDGLTYTGPINRNPGPGESSIIIYTYIPSLALGIVGVITFALILSINIYQLIKAKKGERVFHLLICIGSAMEAGGYGARIYSHYRPFVVVSFIVQYFLIVVAPVLFSAAIYLSLTLLTRTFKGSERLLVVSPKFILAFFITADAICTIIQVAGAALIGVSESANAQGTPETSPVTPKQANDILLAGLACQCFSFSTFLLILLGAIYRSHSRHRRREYSHGDRDGLAEGVYDNKRVKKMLWIILITSDLILLRTVFRLAETAQGFFGYASTHEWLFAILEYLPVILALMIWGYWFPGKLLRSSISTETGMPDERKPVTEDRGTRGQERKFGEGLTGVPTV